MRARRDLAAVAEITETTDYIIPYAIRAAANLAIANILEDDPMPLGDIAAARGADRDALLRLLRGLACVGIFEELTPQVFGNTELSDLLRSEAGHRPHLALSPIELEAWGQLTAGVTTSTTPFELAHGTDVRTVIASDRKDHLAIEGVIESTSAGALERAVVALDLPLACRLADVGGGTGSLAAAVGAIDPSTTVSILGPDADGPSDRFQTVVLHNRVGRHANDDDASVLLAAAARCAVPGGTVAIVEPVVGPGSTLDGNIFDVRLMVLTGGRARTIEELTGLAASSGLAVRPSEIIDGVAVVTATVPS